MYLEEHVTATKSYGTLIIWQKRQKRWAFQQLLAKEKGWANFLSAMLQGKGVGCRRGRRGKGLEHNGGSYPGQRSPDKGQRLNWKLGA